MSTLLAFLHHVAAFTLVGTLAAELVLVRQQFSKVNAARVVTVDGILGIAAVTLLAVGLLRVFFYEKGAGYYFSSYAFLTKLSVFIAMALLSAIPTMEFLSWRKMLKTGQLPSPNANKLMLVRRIIHVELMGVVVILLCAAIMAKGGWN